MRTRGKPCGSEAGYTLVAVVIGMAILTILIAAVAPLVSTLMKRSREEELIFRGRQYARAIGLFQRRYGRYPNQLKELYENKPRTIRKLWKDPMCDCMDWHLIIQGTPDSLAGGPLPGSGAAPPDRSRRVPTPTPSAFGGKGQTPNIGPIVGVRSNVHKEALREWRGQKFYDQWRFIQNDADRENLPFDPNTLRFPGPGGRPTPPPRPRP